MGHFKTPCRNCNEEILLSNENEDLKWKPYDYDEYRNEIDTRYLDYHKCDAPTDFETVCKYCDADIQMSKVSGNWLPYDDVDEGKRHRCRTFQKVERGQKLK